MQDKQFVWRKPSPFTPTAEQTELAAKFKVHPSILHLLDLRDIKGEKAIHNFFQPSLASLPDPFTMKDMEKAVRFVCVAIQTNCQIYIWGDYDVDGVTASCLLVNFFKQIMVNARYYVPNRFTEGYGLNSRGIETLRAADHSDRPLLITVDCGISSPVEIRRAKELGFVPSSRTIISLRKHNPRLMLF